MLFLKPSLSCRPLFVGFVTMFMGFDSTHIGEFEKISLSMVVFGLWNSLLPPAIGRRRRTFLQQQGKVDPFTGGSSDLEHYPTCMTHDLGRNIDNSPAQSRTWSHKNRFHRQHASSLATQLAELPFGDLLQGVKTVFPSLTFWRSAPLTTMSQAPFLLRMRPGWNDRR